MPDQQIPHSPAAKPTTGRGTLPLLLLILILLTAACAGAGSGPVVRAQSAATPTVSNPESISQTATPLPGNLDEVVFIEDGQTYTIRQLIVRDGIMPIYEPQFVRPEEAELDSAELVMGLEINGDARAYPISILRRREMVDDVVGGTPVLVTW